MRFFKHKLIGTGFREPPVWAVFCEDRGRVVLFTKTPWGEDVADRVALRNNADYHACLNKEDAVYYIMRARDARVVEPVYNRKKQIIGYKHKVVKRV